MPVPKIKFQEMTLEENIDIIKWAYFEGNDVFEINSVNCFVSQIETFGKVAFNVASYSC